MHEKVVPLLSTVLQKITVETADDWDTCMSHISMDRDPNHLAPIIELILDDPLKESQGSFLSSRYRIYFLTLFFFTTIGPNFSDLSIIV